MASITKGMRGTVMKASIAPWRTKALTESPIVLLLTSDNVNLLLVSEDQLIGALDQEEHSTHDEGEES